MVMLLNVKGFYLERFAHLSGSSNAMARCAVKLQLADDIEAIKCSGGVVDCLLGLVFIPQAEVDSCIFLGRIHISSFHNDIRNLYIYTD